MNLESRRLLGVYINGITFSETGRISSTMWKEIKRHLRSELISDDLFC